MTTANAMQLKHARPAAKSLQRRRASIERKAAAVNRCWSAAERRLRSELAGQLQLRLLASIVKAHSRALSVA